MLKFKLCKEYTYIIINVDFKLYWVPTTYIIEYILNILNK